MTTRIILLFSFVCLQAFSADVDEPRALTMDLGAPFHDHAVLQRDMPVPVWGWSKPGTKVTVEFAGQSKSATAGEDSKWVVKLDPLKASAEPQEMHISEGPRKETLTDILVGEVWLASGQSNMQWLASKCNVGRVLQKGIAERVEAGEEKPPIIREAVVSNVFSVLQPIEYASGKWSKDISNFSAIAFAFAYDLYKELQVPIGILNCSFSSTAIEAWTPSEGFAGGEDDYSKETYKRILESDPGTHEHKAAWAKFYDSIETAIKANADRIAKGDEAEAIELKPPGIFKSNRDATWLYNARLNPMVPYAIRGGIWNQGYANMGGGFTYYYNLHSLVRGWRTKWQNENLPVYFHQFYSPGVKSDSPNHPTTGSAYEMRLGTWKARDIPNAGMASQIDITGSIHYYNKTVPGQRLARHALKNQYGKDIVADGPSYKSYKVDGNNLIVEFDHAEGGLLVGETGTNAKQIAHPTVIPEGESEVTLFYIADKDRVWHPAKVKIDGEKIVLTADGVAEPKGVSYGTGGVGNQPNIYNKALLPLSPFTYYDHKMVLAETWPDDPMKIAGYEPDPSEGGLLYEYRKMPILSTQFRDNAVLQAGVPVTIWGSAVHDWGYEAKGKAEIKFSFAGIEKTIPVTPGMREWKFVVPAMKASADPKTLKVALEIDGELAHERIAENIVVGDVWFVAAPTLNYKLPETKSTGLVRVIKRKAKRDRFARPSRFSVCVSTTPKNRFASEWLRADEAKVPLASAIGETIAAKTGNPVGIIYMQSSAGKNSVNPPVKSWIPFESLVNAPSLAKDYEILGAGYPGSPSYNANIRNYIADWKKYWKDYVPVMIKEKRVPDESAWGVYPKPGAGNAEPEATQTYNVMVHSFTPTALKGVIFLSSPEMEKETHFAEHIAVLEKGWKKKFGGNPKFIYTIPSKAAAPKIENGVKVEFGEDAKGSKSLGTEQIEKILKKL